MITVAIHSPNNPDILDTLEIAIRITGVRKGMTSIKTLNVSSPSLYLMKEFTHYIHGVYPVTDENVTLTRENFGDVLNFVLLAQYWEL